MNLLRRITALFRKEILDAEMSDEMQHHVELQAALNLKAGMNAEDARYAALRQFGNVASVQEQARQARPWMWCDNLWRDFGYAGRQMRKAPGFAVTAILTVAIGIGACTTLFSLVNGVLLRPLRFAEPERIVSIAETRPPDLRENIPVAPGAYLDWVKQASVFEHLALRAGRSFNVKLDGRAASIGGFAVTANYFAVFGVAPIRGRGFRAAEQQPGNDRVVILSYGAWQTRFGGQESVIGQTVTLNDQAYTIVGVLPDRNLIWNSSIFTPLSLTAADATDYGSHGLACLGRLKPGVSPAQAQADMDVVSDQIDRAHPDSNSGYGARVTVLLDELTGGVRLQLLVLLAAVGFVLLIACVNVASLLLSRGVARQREIAVRAALGASRGRIVRQFLAESLALTTVGGGLGVLFAYVSLGLVAGFSRSYLPRTEEVAVDGSVLALTCGLMLLVGVGVGLAPALQFTRGPLADPLKDAGRGSSAGRKRHRARFVLVVAEIALATMLLAGTGLLARSLRALQQADQGFTVENVYTNNVFLGGRNYDRPEKAAAFPAEAAGRIGTLPDVQAVAFSNGLPMMGGEGLLFLVEGMAAVPVKDMLHTSDYAITPDFFKALGIPVRLGRAFTARDVATGPRVVIINEELARRHFAGVNPLGRRLMIATMDDKPDVLREIVGVVGDVRQGGPQSDIGCQVYEPLTQKPANRLGLIVKSTAPAAALTAAVGQVLRTLDPDLPFHDLRSYASSLAGSWFRQRFSMTLFMVFSIIALLLAAIGIYGVMAFAVNQRTQEIGVRMALGARPRDVLELVLGGAARMVALGLVAGMAGAIGFAQLLRSLLFQTTPSDPLTLAAVAAVLTVVAFFACWLPARRAAKVDPMVALRAE